MADAAERATVKTERAEAREARAQTKAARESAPGFTKTFETRLVTLLELGAVALVIRLLRKPLEHFAIKVAEDVYKGLHVIKDGLKDVAQGIEKAELSIRKDVRARYFEDPVLAHRLGPDLYVALIKNGDFNVAPSSVDDGWDLTIHNPDSSYPGGIPDLFVAGTGRGATQLRGAVAHGVSLQILALTQWFIGNSARLQEMGDFPLEAAAN